MQPIPSQCRAVVLAGFGDSSRLELRTIDTPRLQRPDQVLVRVEATSVNPIEWKMRQGMGLPHWAWRRAIGRQMVLGIDFAGAVVAVGEAVTRFCVGDNVLGAMPRSGAYTEYLVLDPGNRGTAIAHRPPAVSAREAALVPFAGLVAYAGLVTQGRLDSSASKGKIAVRIPPSAQHP